MVADGHRVLQWGEYDLRCHSHSVVQSHSAVRRGQFVGWAVQPRRWQLRQKTDSCVTCRLCRQISGYHLLILTEDARTTFRRTHCIEAELKDHECPVMVLKLLRSSEMRSRSRIGFKCGPRTYARRLVGKRNPSASVMSCTYCATGTPPATSRQ